MIVKINGKQIELKKDATISELVKMKNLEGKMFAIEKNLNIIQKQDYDSTVLADGDCIEIVSLCAGG